MKTTICIAAVALIGTVTIHAQQPLPTFSVTRLPLERDVVKGQPYSAEVETDFVQTLADGNRIVRRTSGRVYRDSEGRVRREEDQPGNPVVTIMDPVGGVSYILEPTQRIARETPNAPMIRINRAVGDIEASIERLKVVTRGATPTVGLRTGVEVNTAGGAQRGFTVKRSGSVTDPVVEERLPDRVIEGVLASGVRVTTTFPAGAIGNELPIKVVSEEWKSPDLQLLVLTDRNDPQTGRSTYRLLKINRAEPDSTLFQVPADYRIVRAFGVGGGGRGTGVESERPRTRE